MKLQRVSLVLLLLLAVALGWYCITLRRERDLARRQETQTRQLLDQLIALKDEDAGVREAAALSLGRIGDSAAFGHLIAALQDEDRQVRRAAVTALRDLLPAVKDSQTRERAAEPLIRVALSEKEPFGPGSIAFPDALLQIPEAAVRVLISALQTEDVQIRSAVALRMGFYLPAVKDPATRAAAAEALIPALKDGKVEPYALGALDTIPEAAIQAVIRAYQLDEDEPAGAAMSERPVVPAFKLANIQAKTIERLIRAMANRREILVFGGLALRKIGQPAFEPLMAALQDGDLQVRKAAALGMQSVLPAVDPATRARALEPLTRLAKEEMAKDGTSYAVPALGIFREAPPVPSAKETLQPGK